MLADSYGQKYTNTLTGNVPIYPKFGFYFQRSLQLYVKILYNQQYCPGHN